MKQNIAHALFSRKFFKWNLSEQNVGKNSEKISNYGLMR